MSTSLRRNWLKCLVAGILLTVGNLAYAQDVQRRSGAAEPERDRAPRQSAVLRGRVPVESRGLAFPLRTTGGPVWIEAELRLDGKVIMSEQRFASPDDRVVHLFAHDAGHLGALRDQDARNPGRVQLRILQGGKPVFDSSLTKFDAQYPTNRATSGPRPRDIAAKSDCSDNCDLYYNDCISWCDPRGNECANCSAQYNNCMASCPTCNDWVEVSRTLIARRNSGSSNYLGAKYCQFEEYYLVEEANAAGCYPNRTVCDYDDDTIFYGFGSGYPNESQCCNDDPGDENYCGGDPAPCG
jgi:hypothetical protein